MSGVVPPTDSLSSRRRANETLDWLTARGIAWEPGFPHTATYRRKPVGEGRAIVDALFAHAERLGVDVQYEAAARSLVQDGSGRVVGVRALGPDGFHEYAARTEHVPVRLTLAASGIEALVHVERGRSTRQFVVGATGLADDCRLTFTVAQATDAYDQRSRYAHGTTVRAAPPQVLIDLEGVLRAAISKALLDTTYGAVFASDASIRARFPL